ncbi:hypothetical protein scyTo_0021603, partial [Scyliorhinus torazame]|nr:hypothetical protein [Scyliorhinus torazame]
IATHEKKAHENWLSARSAERTLTEEKRETANLRQKMIELNQKLSQVQRPSIIKPTPGRPDFLGPPGAPPPLGVAHRDQYVYLAESFYEKCHREKKISRSQIISKETSTAKIERGFW